MADQRRGRPTSYSEQQILGAIAIVLAAGGQPDGNSVKAAMQSHFGVSGGVNAQSLGREVERLLHAQSAQRMRSLVAMLPETVHAGLDTFVENLKTGLIEQQAESFERMREEARREIIEKEHDLACQRRLCGALGAERDAQEERIAELEQKCAEFRAQATADHEKISGLEQVVTALRDQVHLRDEFRSTLLAQFGQLGIKVTEADLEHAAPGA